MRTCLKALAITAVLALSVAPAMAVATKPAGNGNGPQYEPAHPTHPVGPKAGLPAKAKAYGRYCKGESKEHVKGQQGTPYSQCVKGGAKMLEQAQG